MHIRVTETDNVVLTFTRAEARRLKSLALFGVDWRPEVDGAVGEFAASLDLALSNKGIEVQPRRFPVPHFPLQEEEG